MIAENDKETTEIWEDLENISIKSWKVLSRAKQRSDYCHDSKSPSYLVANKRYFQMIKQLRDRGIKQRFVTEVTAENIQSCKKLNKYVELRHLDAVKGNFGIVDGRDYGASANIYDFQSPIQFIYSNVKSFVDQQQYFFETLWNRALPAEKKISEIEEGIPAEVTEIWYGAQEVAKKSWEYLSKARVSSDFCHDSRSPSIFVSNNQYLKMLASLTEKGVKHRFLTEITKENMKYCKDLAKYVELRHLDKIKGNFAILDHKKYGAIPDLLETQPPDQLIVSTVSEFVNQQEYFFETLWNKAIPAEHRIIQLEEGFIAETIENLNDPLEIQTLANNLVRSAKKEVLVVFASQNEFLRQQRARNGFLNPVFSRITKSTTNTNAKNYKPKDKKLDVRIIVPEEAKNNTVKPFKHRSLLGGQHHLSPRVRSEIRHIDVGLSAEVSVLVVDRKRSLVMELKDHISKDSSFDNEENEGGEKTKVKSLGIYTNSKGLVVSTVSMFELLWTHIDLYEELKVRDIAQREFINIAAHELRGPIQPILGLADEIRAQQHTQGRQGKLLTIILNSAANLQKLANNILDVARIENKLLRLTRTHFDVNDLILSVMQNFENQIVQKGKVRIQFKPARKHLSLYADKDRIFQLISNLLANAIKFTDEGLISISSKKRHGNAVEVSVKDTGRGIDKQILSRLFTKFATTSGGSSSTGLGLFISQKIVEAHGGNIYGVNNKNDDSASMSGCGATFTVILPYSEQM